MADKPKIALLLAAAKMAYRSGDRAAGDELLFVASIRAGEDAELGDQISDVAKEFGVYENL